MTFVPIRVASPSRKHKVFAGGELIGPGQVREPWIRPDDPMPPGPLAIFPAKHRDVKLAKGVAWANAIELPSLLILRRSLAEPVLRPAILAGEVALRQVHVYGAHPSKRLDWKKGVIDDDFVSVESLARFPADRARLPDSAFNEDARGPYSALLQWVPEETPFGPERAPRLSMFRFGEQPSVLLLEKKLFDALARALGPAIEVGESGPRFGMLNGHTDPPLKEREPDAAAAADAFYRMYDARKSNARDRALTLASSIWAYWTARLVDAAPAEDTRAASARHAYYAYAYARDVDRAAHAVTRRGAARDECAATEYAVHIDRDVNATTRRALGYHATDVELRARANAERFAATSAPATATATVSAFAIIGFASDGRGVVSGSVRTAGAQLFDPIARRAPGSGVFMADEYGGKGRLRKQKSRAHLFALGDGEAGPIIVRRSAVEALFAGFSKDEVELVPFALHDGKGKLDADFALLDVKTFAPLDRAASKLKLADAKAPVAGGVRIVTRFAWTAETKPHARIFRVLEFPHVLVADQELCGAIASATARAVRASTKAPSSLQLAPLVVPPKQVTKKDEARAASAMSAFFQLQARARDDASMDAKDARRRALAHPLGALAVAAAIDRAPSNETRNATLESPDIAVAYARLVDRGPHADTRRAATRTPQATYEYVRLVDIGFHPLTRASFGRDWSAADMKSWQRELAEVRRDLKSNAPPRLPTA